MSLPAPNYRWLINRLYNTAIRLGHVQKSFDLPLDPEDYARGNLKFGLMEVVYEWAKVRACFSFSECNTKLSHKISLN